MHGRHLSIAQEMKFSYPWKLVEKKSYLHVIFDRDLKVASNAVIGGGFVQARHFLNMFVDKSYNSDTPAADLREWLKPLDVPVERAVAMMTAVHLPTRAIGVKTVGDIPMFAIVTAGVGNAVDITTGDVEDIRYQAGTINTMIFIDACLTDGAMLNAIMSATEAKTKLLADLEIKDSASGSIATGTSTDCIAIACTGRGPVLPYAGSATTIGRGIGQLVYETTDQALKNNG